MPPATVEAINSRQAALVSYGAKSSEIEDVSVEDASGMTFREERVTVGAGLLVCDGVATGWAFVKAWTSGAVYVRGTPPTGRVGDGVGGAGGSSSGGIDGPGSGSSSSGIDGPVSGSSSDGIAWGSSDFVGLGDGAADLVGDGAADLVGAAVADGFGDDVALGEEEGFADEALGDGEAGFFVVVDGDAEDLLEEEVVFFGLREDVEDEVDVDDDVRVAVGVFIGDAEVVADGWTTGTTSAGSISGAMGNLTNWSLTNSASEFAVAMSRLS